ncbi:MAG: hypothetical protein JNM52_10355, partial [Betaproteobacteria bacterium]|nr:hypothetical protein [Betaproteobacteria bacterium]
EGNPIPLMITSNQLPIQDGFVLAFRIHHHPTLHPTAIMMLARTGKVGDALACQENGICAYLRHPIAPNQLQEAITAVLCPPQDNDNPISALVTRHSLREGKAGTGLIVDNDHDHAMLASGALKKHAFRVVLANGLKEALTALEQDVFDVAIIRPDTTNLQKASSIVAQLRISLSGSAKTRFLLAADIEPATMPNEFDALVQTPYSRDTLLSAIQSVLKK